MNETLTPHDALRALSKAQSWEAALETRTAGLTWMIWGIVSPAIFVTYGFAATLARLEGADPGWWMSLLWMPWVAMGVIATVYLWKTAGLAAPRLDDPAEGRRIMWTMFALGGALSVVFAILRPDSGIVPLGGLGVMWFLAGAINAFRSNREGRIVTMVVGSVLLATAVLLAATRAPVEVHGFVSILAAAVVPFAAGLWHVTRG